MNIQQLRYVVAIANSGTFREAASKLFVSQPSLSVAIKDLEQELNFKIFTRTTTGKLMDFNKEAGEKRKEQIQKAQDELQKSVDGADRKNSSYYLEYRNGSISQVQFLEAKKKLEEKKEQDRQTLRDLHTEYSSIDRMVDKQNQFLRTILKYKSCAELNAELVQNLIEKIYVYRGKRVEIIWKWNDEFAKVMGGTDDEK